MASLTVAGMAAASMAVSANSGGRRASNEERLAWLVDRAEIEDLIKRLTFALDDRDWKAAAACFFPETKMQIGGVEIAGPEAFIADAEAAISDISRTQHAPITILVDRVDLNHAKVRTQLLGVYDVTPPDGSARIMTGQRYRYDVRRRGDDWKIAEIQHETVWLEGDPQGRAAPRGLRRKRGSDK